MDLVVKEFFETQGTKTRGYVIVEINEIELNLRVRQYKNEKLWIEMPRLKVGNKDIQPVRLPNKEISDQFQAEVLKQLKDKWPQLKIKETKELLEKNKKRT